MARSLVFLAACSVFGPGCSDTTSTQLVVLMDTDYEAPAEVDRIRARVSKVLETEAGAEEVETWSRVFPVSNDDPTEAGQYALPATFGILPGSGDLDREIIIELEALGRGSDLVLVARRIRTGFVLGQARLVRLLIYRSCAELSCSDGESCGCLNGTPCATPSCVDEWLPPEELESIDDPALLPPHSEFPNVVEPDAGTSEDGSVPSDDGGTGQDAAVDEDGGVNCEPPLTECELECVNTQIDPRYCGDCATVCPGGYVCETGSCSDPGDCRTNDIGEAATFLVNFNHLISS